MGNIVRFLRYHPDILAKTRGIDAFRDRFEGKSVAALSEIARLVDKGGVDDPGGRVRPRADGRPRQ